MMAQLLVLVFVCTLVVSCSSRRLEYQAETSKPTPVPLIDVPDGINFSNNLELASANKNSYSYTPFNTDILVPRPTAVFIQDQLHTTNTIQLAEYLNRDDLIVSQSTDSRGRPAIHTELPIEYVDNQLQSFFESGDYQFQHVDPNEQAMAECVTMYQIKQLQKPLFLCLQTTLRSVYISTQAAEEDDRSLDEEGIRLLSAFAKVLF